MSSVEKRKKSKKPKKSKKAKKAKAENPESEVLERVMDSIEMAGASLDFFEEDSAPEEEVEAAAEEPAEEIEAAADSEVIEDPASDGEADLEMEAAADEELQNIEADVDDSETLEALSEDESAEETTDDLSEAETLDMLEEENQAEFIEQKQALSILESLLFSSDRPLGMGTFKAVFKGTSFKTKDIKAALEELQVEYADPSRGVTLEEINGGWQLRTKVDNMDFLRKLAKARPFKLSGPALEVLAIIAYKQPIVKSEVDDIRGVESGHLVRALMEKHLVCFQGKSELPGKPMQYGTTRKFLEIFGLRNLRELPSLDEIDQLLPDGIGLEEDDEKLSDVTDKMAEEFGGTYSEGEEELEKIEATLGDIDTSSEFFEEEKRRQKEKRDRDRARDIREAMDVGEEVEDKDQRWLERYEAKLAEEQAAAEAAEAASLEGSTEEGLEVGDDTLMEDSMEEAALVAAGEITEPDSDSLEDELSELSAQSEPLVSDEVMAHDEEMELADRDTEEIEFPAADTEEIEITDAESEEIDS